MFRIIVKPMDYLNANSYKGARRGSSYVLVLCVSMIIALIGLSGLIAARIDHKIASSTSDSMETRFYALAAIEIGLFEIDEDPTNWRKSFNAGPLPLNMPIGEGTYTLQVVDPIDGDLLDNPADPILLTGIGDKGSVRHKVQVTVVFTTGIPTFMPGSWKQIVD